MIRIVATYVAVNKRDGTKFFTDTMGRDNKRTVGAVPALFATSSAAQEAINQSAQVADDWEIKQNTHVIGAPAQDVYDVLDASATFTGQIAEYAEVP